MYVCHLEVRTSVSAAASASQGSSVLCTAQKACVIIRVNPPLVRHLPGMPEVDEDGHDQDAQRFNRERLDQDRQHGTEGGVDAPPLILEPDAEPHHVLPSHTQACGFSLIGGSSEVLV
jgi:hypothetical protein